MLLVKLAPGKIASAPVCTDILDVLDSAQTLTLKLLPSFNCCSLVTQSLALFLLGVESLIGLQGLGLLQPEDHSLQTVSAVKPTWARMLVQINVKTHLLRRNGPAAGWGRAVANAGSLLLLCGANCRI